MSPKLTTKEKTGPFSVKKRSHQKSEERIDVKTHKELEADKAKETAALVVSVAEALKHETQTQQRELRSATDQAFELMMKRFDVIEDQNDKQLIVMAEHVKIDNAAHEILQRHATYWKLVIAPMAAILTGLVAWLIHFLLPAR
jgi:hypothetical protein